MPDDSTFPTSLRGYTRELVDAYVARTTAKLADSEQRRTAAEHALAAHRDGAEPALASAATRAGELEQELAAVRAQAEQEVAYRAQVEQDLAAVRAQAEQEVAYRAQVEQELASVRAQAEQEVAYRAQVEQELASVRAQVEQEVAHRAQVEQDLAAVRAQAEQPASLAPDDGTGMAQMAAEELRASGSIRLTDVDPDRSAGAVPPMVAPSGGTAPVDTAPINTAPINTATVNTAPVHAASTTAVQPTHAAPVTDAHAVPSGGAEPVRPEEIRPLPHPRPPGPRRRRSSAPWWTLAGLAAVAAVVLAAALRNEAPARPAAATQAPVAGTPAPTPSVAPSPAEATAEATAAATAAASMAPTTVARPTVLPAGTVPRGWRRFQAPGAPWSIALPPNWRSVGRGDDLRFVSGSGLSQMYVRTVPAAAVPDQAALQRRERAFAATHAGYRRLRVEVLPYKGLPAGFWDYTYGSGRQARRASDMALMLNGRGYQLHVESRAASWRFAAPLVQGFRSSFAPT